MLFLTKYYPPSEGGVERYGQLLCAGLASRGVDVEVVAASEGSARSTTEHIDRVTVHRFGRQMILGTSPVTFQLPNFLRKRCKTFDIIHLNSPNPWLEIVYMTFSRGSRSVLTYHGDIYRPARSVGSFFLKFYNPCIRHLLNQVSAIIATSPNCLQHSPFLRPVRDRCTVIPMPMEIPAATAEGPESPEFRNGDCQDFVLFVGRLVHYKGVEHLIDAMTRIADVHLVVAGRGPLEGVHKSRVEKLGLGQRVHFLGKVSDATLSRLYSECACFVLPSVNHAEAFGIVLAEAMASGKPVISTELNTGTSFVNLDGETGYVVPPKDPCALAEKIGLLVNDIQLREKLGRQARIRAEAEFGKDIVVEKTLKLYEDVLNGVTPTGAIDVGNK